MLYNPATQIQILYNFDMYIDFKFKLKYFVRQLVIINT